MMLRAEFIGLLVLVMLAPGLQVEAADLNFSLDSLLAAPDSMERGDPPKLPATGFALLYFHQTYRCETCLEMERRVREALAEISDELPADERFVFRELDYQDEDNHDLVERFGIKEITLVMTERNGGRITDWRPFGDIWNHEDADDFKNYIHEELRGYFSRRPGAVDNSRARNDGE